MKRRQPERSFPFLRINERGGKPRRRGLTEIRGPYYSAVGRRYLEDLFETMGAYVDSPKFAGGSFTLMPKQAVRETIDLCHKHNALVSTGNLGDEELVGRGGHLQGMRNDERPNDEIRKLLRVAFVIRASSFPAWHIFAAEMANEPITRDVGDLF